MSKELAKTYDPHGMEDRIYQKWLDKKYFHAEPVFYVQHSALQKGKAFYPCKIDKTPPAFS